MPRCEVASHGLGSHLLDVAAASRGRRCSPSRCGLFLFMMIVPAAVSPVSALADKSSAKFPGKTSNWNRFVRYDFQVGGRSVLVVSPDEPVAGKPWVWHGEFLVTNLLQILSCLNVVFMSSILEFPTCSAHHLRWSIGILCTKK